LFYRIHVDERERAARGTLRAKVIDVGDFDAVNEKEIFERRAAADHEVVAARLRDTHPWKQRDGAHHVLLHARCATNGLGVERLRGRAAFDGRCEVGRAHFNRGHVGGCGEQAHGDCRGPAATHGDVGNDDGAVADGAHLQTPYARCHAHNHKTAALVGDGALRGTFHDHLCARNRLLGAGGRDGAGDCPGRLSGRRTRNEGKKQGSAENEATHQGYRPWEKWAPQRLVDEAGGAGDHKEEREENRHAFSLASTWNRYGRGGAAPPFSSTKALVQYITSAQGRSCPVGQASRLYISGTFSYTSKYSIA
jgi:hypothetical protein